MHQGLIGRIQTVAPQLLEDDAEKLAEFMSQWNLSS